MRVVIVGPAYPFRGGIAHYTSALTQRMIERGHPTTLISFRRQYPRWLYPGLSDTDPSQTYQSVQAQYLLDPINPISWWRTARTIAGLKPDLVVIQWWTTFWALAYSAVTWLLRKMSIRVHHLAHNVLPHELRLGDRFLTRWALRNSAGCVVWNETDAERLRHLSPQTPSVVCAMPVCPLPTMPMIGQTEARERLQLPAHIPMALFFGFVRHYKGLRYLIEAAALLRDAGTPVYVLVAGECWERQREYECLIDKLALRQHVRLVGRYIPNEDVSVYFSAADLLVAPYIESTQSAVSTMAFRFGLPLVMSRTLADGQPVFSNDYRVTIVPEADASALARAIGAVSQKGQVQRRDAELGDDGWSRLVDTFEQLAHLPVIEQNSWKHTAV